MSAIMTKSRKSLNRLSTFFGQKAENSSESSLHTPESAESPLYMTASNWPLPESQPYHNPSMPSTMHSGSSGHAPNSDLPPLPAFAQPDQRPRSASRGQYGSNPHSGLSMYANSPQSKSVTSFARPQTAPYPQSSKKNASSLALQDSALPPMPPLPTRNPSQTVNVLRKPQEAGSRPTTSSKTPEKKRKISFFGRRSAKEHSNQNLGPAAWLIGSEQKIPYDLNPLLGGAMVHLLFVLKFN
jgi:hypothetical protein